VKTATERLAVLSDEIDRLQLPAIPKALYSRYDHPSPEW
jgi:hypothetical protein